MHVQTFKGRHSHGCAARQGAHTLLSHSQHSKGATNPPEPRHRWAVPRVLAVKAVRLVPVTARLEGVLEGGRGHRPARPTKAAGAAQPA